MTGNIYDLNNKNITPAALRYAEKHCKPGTTTNQDSGKGGNAPNTQNNAAPNNLQPANAANGNQAAAGNANGAGNANAAGNANGAANNARAGNAANAEGDNNARKANNTDNTAANAITGSREDEQVTGIDEGTVEIPKLTSQETAELKQLRIQLVEINTTIVKNNTQLRSVEYEITLLQEKIEKNLEEAIQKSKEIEEESKEEAGKITAQQLDKYINSNGNMSYDDFLQNLSNALDKHSGQVNSQLSAAVRKIIEAECNMQKLNVSLNSMKTLIESNNSLTQQAIEIQDSIGVIALKIDCPSGAQALEESGESAEGGTDVRQLADNYDTKYEEFTQSYSELEIMETETLQLIGLSGNEIKTEIQKANQKALKEGEDVENLFLKHDSQSEEIKNNESEVNKTQEPAANSECGANNPVIETQESENETKINELEDKIAELDNDKNNNTDNDAKTEIEELRKEIEELITKDEEKAIPQAENEELTF